MRQKWRADDKIIAIILGKKNTIMVREGLSNNGQDEQRLEEGRKQITRSLSGRVS